uniref:Uncharacterized protein n=1 Tax=Tetranychus urticae TaxID=32264 RepID=T1KXG9_TETUR
MALIKDGKSNFLFLNLALIYCKSIISRFMLIMTEKLMNKKTKRVCKSIKSQVRSGKLRY